MGDPAYVGVQIVRGSPGHPGRDRTHAHAQERQMVVEAGDEGLSAAELFYSLAA